MIPERSDIENIQGMGCEQIHVLGAGIFAPNCRGPLADSKAPRHISYPTMRIAR